MLSFALLKGRETFSLYCPSFAVLREKLFSSAAKLLGNRRHCTSDKKKNRLAFNGISNADFAQSFIIMFNSQFLLTILVCFFFLFCSFVTFKRTVNDRLSAPSLASFSLLWVRRLYESGAYQIIFGKVAVLIRVAVLNRSFTVFLICIVNSLKLCR